MHYERPTFAAPHVDRRNDRFVDIFSRIESDHFAILRITLCKGLLQPVDCGIRKGFVLKWQPTSGNGIYCFVGLCSLLCRSVNPT